MACYTKNPGWAMCKPTCVSGLDVTDESPTQWDCEKLGPHTPGHVPTDYWGGLKLAAWVKTKCAGLSENCFAAGCCTDPGMSCFSKDNSWGSCMPSCIPGPNPTDVNSAPWNCVQLGPSTPGAVSAGYWGAQKTSPWVVKNCTADGQNCMNNRCCQEPGTACFRKNGGWAACKAECKPGPDLWDQDASSWDCKQLGARTPGTPKFLGPVAGWVEKTCAGDGASCVESKCCSGPGKQCYQKNDGWATCMDSCTPGVHANDPDKSPWTCHQFGPRTPGNWQSPSLFCWALTMSAGDEPQLLKMQWAKGWSLFKCEEWAVYSDIVFDLGGGAMTTPIGDLTAQKGQWGSWLNTKVFIKAWHSIYEQGQYKNHDWTVKVDPDAVFLPERLKVHVAGIPSNEAWCIHNSDTGTPMLGPIEILNRAAMDLYFFNNKPSVSGTDKAVCENPYMGFSGEDGFISGCLQRLGVKAKYDASILKQDAEDCSEPNFVAFHPCKTVPVYATCEQKTQAPPPPPA